ncbi:MAG: DoxX family protein [Bacteroidales bacterium]|nr:DoxX family protein [Bacteroidales bacterium]
MKNLLYTRYNQQYLNAVILIVRLCAGAFMLTHGIPKFARFFSEDPVTFADPLGIGAIPSLVLVVFAEVFCSIFIMLGLLTRLSAGVLLINMSVAAFVVHGGDAFSGMEKAVLYLLIYFVILSAGAGRYSIDHYLFYKRK